MNDKFYRLSEEKQQRIINAGFEVFAQNSYRKSPVGEIASVAGISKSLLFHYFHNKRELYLFLWEYAADRTVQYLEEEGCYEPTDLFEMMERGMRAKFRLMEEYPYMARFAVNAFYEKDAELYGALQSSYARHFDRKATRALAKLNPDEFVPGLDLQMMYREMYWASEGYLWEMLQKRGGLDAAQMERDFRRLLAFWKTTYLRRNAPESSEQAPERSEQAPDGSKNTQEKPQKMPAERPDRRPEPPERNLPPERREESHVRD